MFVRPEDLKSAILTFEEGMQRRTPERQRHSATDDAVSIWLSYCGGQYWNSNIKNIHMSFEHPANKDSARMELAEAQMEANMMRVKMKEIVDHEPTSEDYDKALQTVEEMKEAAANESDADKAFFKMMQIGNKYFTKLILGEGTTPKDKEWTKHLMHMFDDAEASLNQLKKEAEKLIRDETK